jgi:DNA-binding MarR family transcriptional regulator
MTAARTAADDLDSIEDAVVRLVRGASSPRVQAAISRGVGSNVERSTYVLLRALDPGAALPVSVLAAAVGLDASTVSRQVAGLERAGLVVRSSVPGDRRRSGVTPTEEGASLLQQIQTARHQLFAEVLAGWPPDDLATLAPLLERLADDLLEHGADR